MSKSTDNTTPRDTIWDRANESGWKLWILLVLNRQVLTAALLSVFFLAFIALGSLDPEPLRSVIETKDPIDTLFQALVTAIITGVTLVVTINQLVLSQELGALGDQRKRMEGAMDFKQDVESMLDEPVSPPDPSSFLLEIVSESKGGADRLAATIEGTDNEDRREFDEYISSLRRNAEQVVDRLQGAEFGTFDVLLAALNFNYSWKIYEARRIRNDYSEVLSKDAERAIDQIIESLAFFGPAREHFKTLYFQWELINLSRAVLYAAIPALIATVSMIIFVEGPTAITGSTLGVDNLLLTVSATTTIALLPFMILISYMLRIATVAKRTLAIGPFVLRTIGHKGSTEE